MKKYELELIVCKTYLVEVYAEDESDIIDVVNANLDEYTNEDNLCKVNWIDTDDIQLSGARDYHYA